MSSGSDSDVALKKLRTLSGPNSTLHSKVSNISGREVFPLQPLAETVYSNLKYTFQWNYEERSDVVANASNKLEIRPEDVHRASSFCIEEEFPDQTGGGVTINYAPITGLAAIDTVEVKVGKNKLHELSEKDLYMLLMYVNEQTYRDYILDDLIGDVAASGSTTVTNPGKAFVPVPIEGTNIQGGRGTATAAPLPINRMLHNMQFVVYLKPTSGFADSSEGVPNYIRLWYKELIDPTYLETQTVDNTGRNPDMFFYPTREFVSETYESLSLGTSFTSIDVSQLRQWGELITVMLHITTDTDDSNDLYFNHEEISEAEMKFNNSKIVDIDSIREYDMKYYFQYYLKPYAWGSQKPSSGNPNRLIVLPIAERDIEYESYVGNGANPGDRPIDLRIKTSSSITANVRVLFVYRGMFRIGMDGTAAIDTVPGEGNAYINLS